MWRQPSSNLFWKCHHLTKIFWKTTAPFLTFCFCPKSLKELFSTNFSPISKKTTSATPFSQPIEQDTAQRPFCVVHDILSTLDNDISILLLLDLSATFDTTDHNILLSRLNSVFGIQSTALQWFQSYFSDRYQSTSVNNSSSSPSQLMYGVPQGSVLGPILFVLYTTPPSGIIANHSVNHLLFVDDTQLQKSAPLSEVTSLTKELNACTDDIKTWISSNLMTTKQKLFSFHFHLPWDLPPFPSLTWLLLALTTSPSLILPGSLESFLTQTCPWRSTS